MVRFTVFFVQPRGSVVVKWSGGLIILKERTKTRLRLPSVSGQISASNPLNRWAHHCGVPKPNFGTFRPPTRVHICSVLSFPYPDFCWSFVLMLLFHRWSQLRRGHGPHNDPYRIMSEHEWRWMRVSEDEWRWAMTHDGEWSWVKMSEHEWRWMKMNDAEWTWLKVNTAWWRWMKIN